MDRSSSSSSSSTSGIGNPTDIPDLAVWYDASDLSSMTMLGSEITQWRDISGNNIHANKANITGPTISTAVQNGKGLINFNQQGLMSDWKPNAEMSVVIAMTKIGDPRYPFGILENTRNRRWYHQQFNTNTIDFAFGQSTAKHAGYSYTNGPDIVMSAISSANMAGYCRINGGTRVTFAMGANEYPDGSTEVGIGGIILPDHTIHSSIICNVDIAEVIGFNRVITDEECVKIENYLAEKWGL